jgi:hypothetical protein
MNNIPETGADPTVIGGDNAPAAQSLSYLQFQSFSH